MASRERARLGGSLTTSSIALVLILGASLFAVGLLFPAGALIVSPIIVGLCARRRLDITGSLVAAVIGSGFVWLVAAVIGGVAPELNLFGRTGSSFVLALPAVAAILVTRTSARQAVEVVRGVEGWLAPQRLPIAIAGASGPVLIVATAAVAWSRFGTAGAAWTMSGDARNHVLLARQIVRSGGVDSALWSWYPALPNAILALLMGGRPLHAAPSVAELTQDLRALEVLMLSAIVATSLLFAATACSFRITNCAVRTAAVAAASFAPLSGLVIGVALRDGYVSAIITLPFLLAALLGITLAARPSEVRRGLLTLTILAVPVLAATWTVIAPPILAALGLLLLASWRHAARRDRLIYGLSLALSGALTIDVVAPLMMAGTAGSYVTRSGSIAAPPAELLIVVTALAGIAVLGLIAPRTANRVPPYWAAAVVVLAIVAYAVTKQSPAMTWGYYPAKLAWMWVCVSVPFVIGAGGVVVQGLLETGGPRQGNRESSLRARAMAVAAAAMLFIAAWFALEAVSPTPPPVLDIDPVTLTASSALASGWNQPSASIVRTVLDISGDPGVKQVIWNYLDPGNDRLGNFWLAALDPPLAPQPSWPVDPFADWAYFEAPGDPKSLCELLRIQPERRTFPASSTPVNPDSC